MTELPVGSFTPSMSTLPLCMKLAGTFTCPSAIVQVEGIMAIVVGIDADSVIVICGILRMDVASREERHEQKKRWSGSLNDLLY